jgi:hypothetical protein
LWLVLEVEAEVLEDELVQLQGQEEVVAEWSHG